MTDPNLLAPPGARATTGGGPPTVTGLSPTEGTPGTQITIRGENLGVDQNDILMLFICGTDCLHSVKWKSPSKIVARLGQANRGLGEVKLATKSGGRGVSHVKFRVFIAQVGPLEETAVWVDESRTVPGREAVRMVATTSDEKDALGLIPSKKMDAAMLQREFPDGSSNLRMESFDPQWYLLENHSDTSIGDLREAIKNMELAKADEAKKSEQVHKANLYSLINCVDALANLHDELERGSRTGEFAVINQIGSQINDARAKAESVFKDVLSRKDRADATRNALSVLTRFKFIFFLSKTIDDNMKKGEYLTILNDYTRAKSLYKDTEVPLFKEVMAQLEVKMDNFKEEMKHKLIDTPASYEEQSKLIKYLKILEPDSDPTWECITAYHCWLEDVLWKLQEDHYKKAVEAAASTSRQQNRFALANLVPVVETNERQSFVSALVDVLINKLQSFWKLSNTYNTNDERWAQKQDDISQMLTNTINVSSWLILNALVPKALPDDVLKRYESQFVRWPALSVDVNRNVLIHSLKTIRMFISSLLDSHFTTSHVQPLIELCMTVRLKLVSDVIDKGVDAIGNLGKKENWQQEFVDQNASKTALPDFYENEVLDCISSVRDALSTTGFPGESCLFQRERFRSTLIEIFVHLVASVRHCFDRLLNLRNESKRPTDLELDNGKEEGKSQLTTKKLLISVCNVEYLSERTLRTISRRMNECGVKYADIISEKSKAKLANYRSTLIRCYITIKCSAFQSLIKSATYSYFVDEDVSDFAKEIMMCCVLQQAELQLCAPHLMFECLQATVQSVFSSLLDHLIENGPNRDSSCEKCTQCVVDICALEQALSPYMTLETRTHLNGFRAELVSRIDQAKLAVSLNNMRSGMRMALESLERPIDDELNTSSI